MRRRIKIPRKPFGKKGPAFSLLWFLLFIAAYLYNYYYGFDSGRALEIPLDDASLQYSASDYDTTFKARVCTFNFKNYLGTDRSVNGIWRKNYPKPENEKQELCEIVKRINPDILLIQEIGDEKYLKEFLKRIAKIGLAYRYATLSKGSDPDRHLAIVSKIKIEKVHKLDHIKFVENGYETKSPRGALFATFNLPNTSTWALGAIHLKSKYGARKSDNDFNSYRKLELSAILTEVNYKFSKNPVAIAGDFNDEAITPHIASVLKKFSFTYVIAKDTNGNPYTYYWSKTKEYFALDYFIINPTMQKAFTGAVPLIYGIPKVASDHSPVFVDLDFSGYNN